MLWESKRVLSAEVTKHWGGEEGTFVAKRRLTNIPVYSEKEI